LWANSLTGADADSRDGDIEVLAVIYQREPGRGESYNGGQGSYELAYEQV